MTDGSIVRCVILLLGVSVSTATAAPQGGSPPQCRPDDALVAIPELVEASGIAVSRRVPGRLWTHNEEPASQSSLRSITKAP